MGGAACESKHGAGIELNLYCPRSPIQKRTLVSKPIGLTQGGECRTPDTKVLMTRDIPDYPADAINF